MAKEKNETIGWKEIVEMTSEQNGIPKTQIDTDCMAVHGTIQSTLTEHQPKKPGDSLTIDLPFCSIVATRLEEQVITDPSGNKITRGECVAINYGVPTDYIAAANEGLIVDEEVNKKEEKEKRA